MIPLAYFLILPFAVQASRSFQPDPLMTVALIAGVYFLYRWSEDQRWRWALLARLLSRIGRARQDRDRFHGRWRRWWHSSW